MQAERSLRLDCEKRASAKLSGSFGINVSLEKSRRCDTTESVSMSTQCRWSGGHLVFHHLEKSMSVSTDIKPEI